MSEANTSHPDLRPLLECAFRAAVAAADPSKVIVGHLPSPPRGRLLVVGAGKAAAVMAAAVDSHYGDEVELSGLVIVPGPDEDPRDAARAGRIEVARASHPVPDSRGLAATERILAEVACCSEHDLVMVLVSGGGSALLVAPDALSLAEMAELTDELLRSGADINEMNAVRKHLSRVKGGRLAMAAAPAKVLALVLSDVVGDDLSTIASGPTVADPSSYHDALGVLDRYGVKSRPARDVLVDGTTGKRAETPKPAGGELAHAETRLLGGNQLSLDAAAKVLGRAGFAPHLLSSTMVGESREVARVHAAITNQILERGQPFSAPCALLSGGETTVTVRGSGRGGRNSEFGLALALALPAGAPVWALAADTDGIDGSGDNAGVLLSPSLLSQLDRRRAAALLQSNDSYTLFAESDHLLVSGPTGTNVNDLRVVIISERGSGPADGQRQRHEQR